MNNSKLEKLKSYFKSLGSAAIAFSSGVDSTFMLKIAHNVLGDNAIAITASSHSFPKNELEESKEFCKSENIKQIIFESDELNIPGFAENPKNRCYICKRAIFSKILEIAQSNNIIHVCEGSNMDDNNDYRPGMIAIKELSIKSPLRECELYKLEIRQFSKDLNLPTWQKPSFACLASRFVYGERITAEKLDMVGSAEQLLLNIGFKQERVRIHSFGTDKDSESSGTIARIEVNPEELEKVLQYREIIVDEFKKIGFSYVSLDLQGYRTGSMNETIKNRN